MLQIDGYPEWYNLIKVGKKDRNAYNNVGHKIVANVYSDYGDSPLDLTFLVELIILVQMLKDLI